MTPPQLPGWTDATIVVLSTVGDGAPYAIPVSTAVRAGPGEIMLALARDGGSLQRLRVAPEVALTVITAGNIAVTAHGRAAVVQETLDADPRFAAVRMTVERIQDHTGPASVVLDGVRWEWRDREAGRSGVRIVSALRSLAAGGETAGASVDAREGSWLRATPAGATVVPRHRVVVFDLDGTLLPGTTSSVVIADALGHGEACRALERRYAASAVSNREISDLQAAWFAGATLDDVRGALRDAPWIDGLADTLAALAEAGCRLLLATLAWRFAAELVPERHRFAAVSGAEATIEHATLAGTVSRYFEDDDKVSFVARWCAQNGYGPRDVVAIGDSRSDVPLFGSAARSIALNASAEARAAAREAIDTDDLRDLLPMLLHETGVRHPGQPRDPGPAGARPADDARPRRNAGRASARHSRRDVVEILSQYTGYPDLANGRPCGLWAYTIANATRPVTFLQNRAGGVRRGSADGHVAEGDLRYVVDVPLLDPGSDRPRVLYYAAIETNPAGVMVSTLPKGTQDVIARKEGVRRIVELGQKRQLVELLREFGVEPDLRSLPMTSSLQRRREAELQRLHVLAIEALLERGYDVRVESTFDAAIRETREEHGFDFHAEQARVSHVDAFVEPAFSKRLPDTRIAHYVFAAHVSDFDATLPRVSVITEDKDPSREGGTYLERGVFLTLAQMWTRAREARAAGPGSSDPAGDLAVRRELHATRSRLQMLDRIERSLVNSLRARGVEVNAARDPRGVIAIPSGAPPRTAAARSSGARTLRCT